MKIRFNRHRPPRSFDGGIDPISKNEVGYWVTLRYLDENNVMRTIDLQFSFDEAKEIAGKLDDFKKFLGGE